MIMDNILENHKQLEEEFKNHSGYTMETFLKEVLNYTDDFDVKNIIFVHKNLGF